MTKKTKKEKELEILRSIYSKKRFPRYTFSERPDFIMHSLTDFGVEITEYYPDDTVARLHNMTNYVDNIVNKSYIHKDDKRKLEVVSVEYEDTRTGKWKRLGSQGVLQRNKTIIERHGILFNQILSKSRLFKDYDKSLSRIDLIVYDSRNSLLDGVSDDEIINSLTSAQPNGIFQFSGFEYIYVVIPGNSLSERKAIKLK